MPTKEELVAHQASADGLEGLERVVATIVGADRVVYQNLHDLEEAIQEEAKVCAFAYACVVWRADLVPISYRPCVPTLCRPRPVHVPPLPPLPRSCAALSAGSGRPLLVPRVLVLQRFLRDGVSRVARLPCDARPHALHRPRRRRKRDASPRPARDSAQGAACELSSVRRSPERRCTEGAFLSALYDPWACGGMRPVGMRPVGMRPVGMWLRGQLERGADSACTNAPRTAHAPPIGRASHSCE